MDIVAEIQSKPDSKFCGLMQRGGGEEDEKSDNGN